MTGLWIIYWGLLGTAVGSFLNVAADRLITGGSLTRPPSHCPGCQRRLRARELIPVLSYLALRGRCRTCGAIIGARSLWVELGTGLLFAAAASRPEMALPSAWLRLAFTSAYLAALMLVTVTDLEHGLILNRVLAPVAALAVLDAALRGWPEFGLRLGAGVLGAGLIALIIALVPGGMGWGDAKLTGFIGLITGLPGLGFALFIGFVGGGLVAALLLLTGKVRRGQTLPLGPFLTLGATVTILGGPLLLQGFHALAALF